MNALQKSFIGFILDILPNDIKSPNGKERTRVTAKSKSVTPNPSNNSYSIDTNCDISISLINYLLYAIGAKTV